MKHLAQVVVFAALIWPLTTHAQSKPDFSGTWTMDVARSESPRVADKAAVSPVTELITQTPSEIRIETVRDGKPVVAKFPLADPAQPRPVGTSGGIGSILTWEDGTLETVTPHEIHGMAVTTIERRTLSADGKEMTVVTRVQVQHGYQAGINTSAPATDVYRRR